MARMPEDLIYSAEVGVLHDYLTVKGEGDPNSRLGSLAVPFQRIVQIETLENEVIRDEPFYKDLESVHSWLGRPTPMKRKLRVNNDLVRDMTAIMEVRQSIGITYAKLGATAVAPAMPNNMELLLKGAKPPFGKWAAFGLEAEGRRYEMSRVVGGENRAPEFLNLTSDGTFGIFSIGRTKELEELLQTRATQMLMEQGYTQKYMPSFRNVGYYMPKRQDQQAAA